MNCLRLADHTLPIVALLVLGAPPATAEDANRWQRLEHAAIEGRRSETPLGYSPELNRFLILGGRTNSAEYKKSRSFDQLTLDLSAGISREAVWQNHLPPGIEGPPAGPFVTPGWKGEKWGFADAAGNVRPNWSIYGTFSLGHAYDYDPDTKTFLCFANGSTFRYDPAARSWTDLKPATNPQTASGGILLWSSLCYDRGPKKFVLFGGGNVRTDRGDLGTWLYSAADNAWEELKLAQQPPQRANSPLVYDPVAQKVVLFGGDRLSELVADTWLFDTAARTWEQAKCERGPSPRAGHALMWLPRAQKVALLGGYGYTSDTGYVADMYRRLPFEAWTFDAAAAKWELIQRWEQDAPEGPKNGILHAAVNEDDVVVTTGANGSTWACRLDSTKSAAAATEKFAALSTAVERRTGPYDPAWFRTDVPAADPEQVKRELASLPANEWVLRPTPKLPRPNMDWGSAVYLPERDQIVRFSGGHSAYSGTAPIAYDVRTDRYSLPFAPELPIEFVYSNDQVHGEWSFRQNPWMTGHTYKATACEPRSQALVFAAHDFSYFFDAAAGRWSRNKQLSPFQPNMYVVTLVSTPAGVIAWGDQRGGGGAGLWKLDSEREWQPLPLTGTLPEKSPDRHGAAYDAKRERLLFFSSADKDAGNVTAYDLKRGVAEKLNPAGQTRGVVSSRETIYLPEWDAVLVAARIPADDGKQLWALYDCARNAWCGCEFGGVEPIPKGSFNNSLGLMFDPNRNLVWAVGQNSQVYVLRPDAAKARKTDLGSAGAEQEYRPAIGLLRKNVGRYHSLAEGYSPVTPLSDDGSRVLRTDIQRFNDPPSLVFDLDHLNPPPLREIGRHGGTDEELVKRLRQAAAEGLNVRFFLRPNIKEDFLTKFYRRPVDQLLLRGCEIPPSQSEQVAGFAAAFHIDSDLPSVCESDGDQAFRVGHIKLQIAVFVAEVELSIRTAAEGYLAWAVAAVGRE